MHSHAGAWERVLVMHSHAGAWERVLVYAPKGVYTLFNAHSSMSLQTPPSASLQDKQVNARFY